MGWRPQRRNWTLAGVVAIGVALLAPANAAAARVFTLGTPKLGDMSVARVEMSVTPKRAVLLGMRVANARGLPNNTVVVGRLQRVGRSNRYILRVVVLRSDPARSSGRASADGQAQPIRIQFKFGVVRSGRFKLLVGREGVGVNVVTEPKVPVPAVCFLPQSNREWSNFVPLFDPRKRFEGDYDRIARAARDSLCRRPVRGTFFTDFGTVEPEPAFAGVHRPFEGSRFEHVFQIHGNVDASGLIINPPAGGAFTNCAGAPCFIESGRILIPGPFRAGTDVRVNGRADLDIGVEISGDAYQGNSTGVFEGQKYRFQMGYQPD